MKNILFLAIATISLFSHSASRTPPERSGLIGTCALDPILFKAEIKKLDSKHQPAFVADVIEAVIKIPASDDMQKANVLNAVFAASIAISDECFEQTKDIVLAIVPSNLVEDVRFAFTKPDIPNELQLPNHAFGEVVNLEIWYGTNPLSSGLFTLPTLPGTHIFQSDTGLNRVPRTNYKSRDKKEKIKPEPEPQPYM